MFGTHTSKSQIQRETVDYLMPTPNRTTVDILRDAQVTLATAFVGLSDLMEGPPSRKSSGLRNLIVFGRAFTNVLQNLRSTESGFEIWYKKYVDEMESDPLMRYFYDLRSPILKEGVLETSVVAHVKRLVPSDMARFGLPPPFARSFFIGDELGGTGWTIELPDGTKAKYYAELPSEIGSVALHFPNPPDQHLDKKIDDCSVETLSKLYLDYLNRMLEDAIQKFGIEPKASP
jgi:hypothetical protein